MTLAASVLGWYMPSTLIVPHMATDFCPSVCDGAGDPAAWSEIAHWNFWNEANAVQSEKEHVSHHARRRIRSAFSVVNA